MWLLISALAGACELQFDLSGAERLSLLDGAVDVPPNVLPSSTWVGAPGYEGASGWLVAIDLTDALGDEVPGEEEVLPNRVVFHPAAPLVAGATYTATNHAGQTATFTVGSDPMVPPDSPPELLDGVVTRFKENLADCSVVPNFETYHDLVGTLSAPTAGSDDGVVSWTRIYRVGDEDGIADETPGTWVPSGTGGPLLRWVRSDSDDLACFRFQEEDGAGNLSERSETTCLAVEPACGCRSVAGGSAPGLAAWVALAVVRRRRVRNPSRGAEDLGAVRQRRRTWQAGSVVRSRVGGVVLLPDPVHRHLPEAAARAEALLQAMPASACRRVAEVWLCDVVAHSAGACRAAGHRAPGSAVEAKRAFLAGEGSREELLGARWEAVSECYWGHHPLLGRASLAASWVDDPPVAVLAFDEEDAERLLNLADLDEAVEFALWAATSAFAARVPRASRDEVAREEQDVRDWQGRQLELRAREASGAA